MNATLKTTHPHVTAIDEALEAIEAEFLVYPESALLDCSDDAKVSRERRRALTDAIEHLNAARDRLLSNPYDAIFPEECGS